LITYDLCLGPGEGNELRIRLFLNKRINIEKKAWERKCLCKGTFSSPLLSILAV
jgi:hypothetical protein